MNWVEERSRRILAEIQARNDQARADQERYEKMGPRLRLYKMRQLERRVIRQAEQDLRIVAFIRSLNRNYSNRREFMSEIESFVEGLFNG